MQPGWHRIMIIGCGGTGKSSLAIELGKILGMEVIHRILGLKSFKDIKSFLKKMRVEVR